MVFDDEQGALESCMSLLRQEGYQVVGRSRGEDARELLQKRGFDIVLINLDSVPIPGIDLLRTCLQTKPDTHAIVTSQHPSVASSMEAMQAGAWEYLPKPFSATHLQILVGRASDVVTAAREAKGAVAGTRSSGPDGGRRKGQPEEITILGQSPALLSTIELARKVALTDASVFITGESGTGKELIAQFIHQNSRRKNRPLVALNCAALPETLLESEMFGHCKGAFTGAIRDKRGLLEAANGGTLFLDELSEMSLPIQAKLLRIIQDGVVRRVGSESVDAVVDVRFIAAMNRDPREVVAEGRLRKDLFYRLGVVPIEIPPLRSRSEDIAILAEHFLTHYWRRHRDSDPNVPRLTLGAIRSLQSRSWAGNVRELQNVMEHAAVFLEPGTWVEANDIPYSEYESPLAASHPEKGGHFIDLRGIQEKKRYHIARKQVTSEFELYYLSWLIESTGANMSMAAKVAGIDRTTLYRLMEKHGLQRDTILKAPGR